MAVAMSVACSSIDCPLNNRTYMSMKLTGNKAVLEDTLTIAAERTPDNPDEDTVLINRQTGLDSLTIPMSYSRTEDVYFLTLVQKDTPAEDSGHSMDKQAERAALRIDRLRPGSVPHHRRRKIHTACHRRHQDKQQ